MHDDSSLQPLLDRLLAGDATARNELLGHSRARLRELTGHMLRRFPQVRRYEETSDVVQNVLIRLNQALQGVTLPTAGDYLRLCSAHIRWELIDLVRKHGGPLGAASHCLPPGADDRPAEGVQAGTDDPINLARWGEFHEAIAALNPHDRDLFDLLYYQGLSHQEAAGVLGMAVKTLKAHWRDARIRLMTRFSGSSLLD